MLVIGPDKSGGPIKDVSLTQGSILDPHLPSSALHGTNCLHLDFTCLAKLALEKDQAAKPVNVTAHG